MQDIHAIWHNIGFQWRLMKGQAPEGYEPIVHLHLLGSSEAIPVGRVETHVLHDRIAHAEISFQRKEGKQAIGFSVSEAKGEAATEA